MEPNSNEYDELVDYRFLKAHEVEVVHYKPWQLGLFHPDLKGKFLWYPRAGTLMFDGINGNYTVREKGDFTADIDGDRDSTERVYNEIMSKIIEQQS